jgi:hypothetical protein
MREGAQASRRVRVVGVALQAPHRELGGREVAGGHNHEHALARILEEVHLAMDTHVVEGAARACIRGEDQPFVDFDADAVRHGRSLPVLLS